MSVQGTIPMGPMLAQATPIPAGAPAPERAAPAGPDTEPDVAPDDELGGLAHWAGRWAAKSEGAALTSGIIYGAPIAGAAGYGAFTRQTDMLNQSTMRALGVGARSALPKITPALAFGVAGVGIADGVSMIAPNIVKPYKRDMSAKDKSAVQVQRAAAAAVGTTAVAGGLWLRFPQVFKTRILGEDVFLGASRAATQAMTLNRSMTMAPATMRSLAGVAGFGAAAAIGGHAVLGGGDSRRDGLRTAGITAGATGAALLAMPLVTRGHSKAVVGMLPDTLRFRLPRPSPELIKRVREFATVAAPVSVVPATDAAYRHFDVVDAANKLVEGQKRPPARNTTPPARNTTPARPPTR